MICGFLLWPVRVPPTKLVQLPLAVRKVFERFLGVFGVRVIFPFDQVLDPSFLFIPFRIEDLFDFELFLLCLDFDGVLDWRVVLC